MTHTPTPPSVMSGTSITYDGDRFWLGFLDPWRTLRNGAKEAGVTVAVPMSATGLTQLRDSIERVLASHSAPSREVDG